MSIDANLVKTLRERTGAGMMDCKKALVDSKGDLDLAVDFLRKSGIAKAEKKSSRDANEGLVVSYIHHGSKLGVLLEIGCETDFVAKTDGFLELANSVAMQIQIHWLVMRVAYLQSLLLKKKKFIQIKQSLVGSQTMLWKKLLKVN